MNRRHKSLVRGFSLVELTVAMAASAILAIAAYRVTAGLTYRASRATRTSQGYIEGLKAMDRLSQELNNAIVIPNGIATALGNRVTQVSGLHCSGIVDPLDGADSAFVPNGLVVISQHWRDEIDQSGTLDTFDPRMNPGTPSISDALRVAFVPRESKEVRLMTDLVDDTADLLSNPFPPFEVDAAPGAPPLDTGDFVIVSDTHNRELFRVTGISPDPPLSPTKYLIFHEGVQSIWNKPFRRNFLADFSTLRRVELATYAVAEADRTLYRDGHVQDDHFDLTTRTFATPGRVLGWVPVAMGIESLAVTYSAQTWSATSGYTNQKLRAGLVAGVAKVIDSVDASRKVNCENQIGFPNFDHITVDLTIAVDEANRIKRVGPNRFEKKPTLTTISKTLSPYAFRVPPGGPEEDLDRDAISDGSLYSGGGGGSTCTSGCPPPGIPGPPGGGF